MALATSSSSALILLVVSALALAIWAIAFKLAGKDWRYELFSIDFGIGLALAAVAGSFLVGFGGELGFADQLLLSSRTNQAYAGMAALFFAFGSTMLMLAVSLLGVSIAYPIATGSAMLVLAAMEFNSNRTMLLAGAVVAAVLAIIFSARAASAGEATLPAASLPSSSRRTRPASKKVRDAGSGTGGATKGIMIALVAGLALGTFAEAFAHGVFADFGLGPIAGTLVFSLSALGGLAVLSLILMNVALHGSAISLGDYFRGKFSGHLFGLLGGIFCCTSILAFLLTANAPEEFRPEKLWLALAALAPCIVVGILALLVFREQSGAPGSLTSSLLIGTLLLAASVALFGMALDKTAPAPTPNSKLLRLAPEQFRG